MDFLLKSGWRRDEVLKLRWSDCNVELKHATTRIKGGDVVTRPLSKALLAIIERQTKAGPYVFTYECQQSRAKRRKGERYPLTATSLRKPFAQALIDAKISAFRLHDLRHTRGTRIVRSTGSLAAAKEALKHRSIATTLRYAHVMDEDVRRALEASDHRNNTEEQPDQQLKA
ncbi:MAG: tyrosine-type recombinase/integrase [Novosphingobium sp.]